MMIRILYMHILSHSTSTTSVSTTCKRVYTLEQTSIPVRFPLRPSHESHEHQVPVVGPVSHEYFQLRINALPSRSNLL